MKKLISKNFIKYCICGSLTGILEIALFYLFNNICNFQYIIANTMAFTLSVVFSYFVNKKYVFNVSFSSKRERGKKFVMFFVSRMAGLLIDTGVLTCCISVLYFDDMVSKLVACVSTTIVNYYVGKVLFK